MKKLVKHHWKYMCYHTHECITCGCVKRYYPMLRRTVYEKNHKQTHVAPDCKNMMTL